MKCEICHKNEATIHIQEITSSGKKKVNLCIECVLDHKLGTGISDLDINAILKKFSTEVLKTEPSDIDLPVAPFALHEKKDLSILHLKCGSCGWSGAELKKIGRLGCGECYRTFQPVLNEIIKDMHRDSVHIGKRPVRQKVEPKEIVARLSILRKELEKCIEKEEYEQAAVIRDKINELKQLSNQDRE